MSSAHDAYMHWDGLAKKRLTTLALNWFCSSADPRSGFGLALCQNTLLVSQQSLTNPPGGFVVIPAIGALAERLNGPFYAGDDENDVHAMPELGQHDAKCFPMMLSRDFAKFGPGVKQEPAAPFAFEDAFAGSAENFPRKVWGHILYGRGPSFTHPHLTPTGQISIAGRWVIQTSTPFAPPAPPPVITPIPDAGDSEMPPDPDGTTQPPGGGGGGGNPGHGGGNPDEDDAYPKNGMGYTPLSTFNPLGAPAYRAMITSPNFYDTHGLAARSNPPANLLKVIDSWGYAPIQMGGFGSQAGRRPGTGTGGFLLSGTDLTEQQRYEPSAASGETPYFMLRQEVKLAIGGYPTRAGGHVSGWTGQRNSSTGDLALASVDSAGASDPLQRITENGYRLPRAHEAAGAPTVNDDELDGFQRGDTWTRTSNDHVYILQDAATGAASWLDLSAGGGGGGTVDTVVAGAGVDVDATDPANPIVSVGTNEVTDAMLRQGAAVSIVGRSANSTGNLADIAAGANDRLLSRVSNALAFTQLTAGMVPSNTIALAGLVNAGAGVVLGRRSGSAGSVEEVSIGSGLAMSAGAALSCTVVGGITTPANDSTNSFTIPAIGATVTSVIRFPAVIEIGSLYTIDDGTRFIVARVTAISGATITWRNMEVVAGAVSDTMDAGAIVNPLGTQAERIIIVDATDTPNYQFTTGVDKTYIMDPASGTTNNYLPPIAQMYDANIDRSERMTIKVGVNGGGGNTITLNVHGDDAGATIDGAGTLAIATAWSSVMLTTDGANWQVRSGFLGGTVL